MPPNQEGVDIFGTYTIRSTHHTKSNRVKNWISLNNNSTALTVIVKLQWCHFECI